ncbi:hypothetical protein P3342_001821 [Pyrenophora teres f. teres]|nr:hypothetical protein P3342_001821 [Pyrenophora teres f. teres]
MTTASFSHIDTTSYTGKPWNKVDGPGVSFTQKWHERSVHNLRGQEAEFNTDNSGFAVYKYPAKEKLSQTRRQYSKATTLRLRLYFQVHVDQTPGAAEARVRRHLPADEAEQLIKGRYQIINIWRPIENPASDHPLAVIDWRTTSPSDFVATDLLYPKRADSMDVDDRGKEVLPDPNNYTSTEGYEVRGETMAVAPNDNHRFYYVKDMTPEEVLLLKCFDSYGEGMEPHGKKGLAVRTPHTAFSDPNTPKDAPGRQSIEVRCLVFYE